MEWNFKAPSTSWDFVEVDQTTLTNMETNGVDGSSRYGEFSVDLKLGHVVGNSNSKAVVGGGGGVSKMTSSSGSGSGSSKRARGINNGIQTVLCLVDGCQADLSNCRDYHRRHKVCELHSKTAQVTIGGHKQRFCQQCSRFHSLEEFDEGKRSCRKRLDGHNRRRRKPQAEPITRSGSFLSNYQGTQLLPFSSSHMYPSTAMVNPSWGCGSVVTSSYPDIRIQNQQMHHHHHHHLVDKQDLYLGTSPTNNNYKEVKNMPFIQHGGHSATLSSNENPHLIPSETFRRSNNPFSVNDSTCALSLLSSTQQTHHRHHHHDHANGLNQQMMNNHHSSSSSTSFMQPLGLSLHDHHSSLGSVDPVMGSSGSDHCSSMYDMGSSESQGNEAPPLYPFQWE